MNGSGKRDSTSMSFQRKDSADGRLGGGSTKGEGKSQNGTRSGFRTDTAISNNRAGNERSLKRWVPDAGGDLDGALEKTAGSGTWDQFAENERLFGLKTDYNENYYTTAIDKSHPQYGERLAAAERKAREIEKSAPTTAHVAEERIMDFATGDDQGGGDEEDKYSGVRRQPDIPPLAPNRDNKYTPPARRAPTGHTTVTGAPVDPAIISSQIKSVPGQGNKKQLTPNKPDETKTAAPNIARSPSATAVPQSRTPEPKSDAKLDAKPDAKSDSKPADAKQPGAVASPAVKEPEAAAKPAKENNIVQPVTPAVPSSATFRPAATPARASLTPSYAKATASTTSSSTANSPAPPSVADNVENALLKDFKDFASQQRLHAEKARHNKMKADAQVKLQELKKFATSFKLSTPVPNDLISIIAKDPAKQKQIQEKALQNAEELAKSKVDPSKTKTTVHSSGAAKAPTPAAPAGTTTAPSSGSSTAVPATTPTPGSAPNTVADTNRPAPANARPQGPMHNSHSVSPSGVPNRHPNARPPYMQQPYRQQSQSYRGDRSGPQHMSQGHNTGNLAERIRNSDQNRYAKQPSLHPQHYNPPGDMRPTPTGPANSLDPNYARRIGPVLPAGQVPQKLNPTTHEFRPSPFAASFNPTGPSAGSSPRSALNHTTSEHASAIPSTAPTVVTSVSPRVAVGVLIRRKANGVDPEKCDILSHVVTIKPPQGRNWNENDGLRPSYDTPPLWRQLADDEPTDSTMRLTYIEYFERMAFAATSAATPVQGHAMPHGMNQLAHQHQLPLHLQQHGGPMGPRPSPHMPPLPMHAPAGGPHGHAPHVSFNGNDDHRMMPSNSAQSYASPRLAQVPMYPQQVGATPQMAYNQPMMQPFMPNGPQINQFRNFVNNPQYIAPQPGPMVQMMPPQHFVAISGGMIAAAPQQMPVYPGGHQFMPPPGATGAGAGGIVPSQQVGGSNGYPSPSRPIAAPMMVQQGSQPGQPLYGMSPSMQYQQPNYGPQHPGHGTKVPMRGGYNNNGPQQFGTSPQNLYQYGPPHRNGSGNYGNKNYQNHNQGSHQGQPIHHGGHSGPPPLTHQNRGTGGDGGAEETK
ncbi:pab1-binding protein [Niveomyces insectorum RCEF 264]|uniref:Pab1-binding protein n=1 Tax=Niveomyces insectorum RCEF 264 TaxID=1081102 RepID=A0A167NRS4_9HYPO|nr:pab1-binding protein [Niveomyces insectorum RCEF 264]